MAFGGAPAGRSAPPRLPPKLMLTPPPKPPPMPPPVPIPTPKVGRALTLGCAGSSTPEVPPTLYKLT
ncbi:MAG: hypothetical protein EOO98_07155, partial [Pedobacter sp.]